MSGLTKDEIETVTYQARSAAENRACGSRPCDHEFPYFPSRWCGGCLIASLRQQLRESSESLEMSARVVASLHADLNACRPYLQDGETPAQGLERLTQGLKRLADEQDELGECNTALRHQLNDAANVLTRYGEVDEKLAEAQATIARLSEERDRETELRRSVERHNAELRTHLDREPYADEYDQMRHDLRTAEARVSVLTQQHETDQATIARLRSELMARVLKAEKYLDDGAASPGAYAVIGVCNAALALLGPAPAKEQA